MIQNILRLQHRASDGFGGAPVRADSRFFRLLCVSAVLLGLTGCGPAIAPTPLQQDQQLMQTTTSPIPGAVAKLLPATTATPDTADADDCVTDAGYCPLASAAAAGRNCLCEAGSLAYGGKTGIAPKTIKAPGSIFSQKNNIF